MQDTQKEKLSAIECECGSVEVWWNDIKKCVTYYDWFGWENKQEVKKAMDCTGNDQ